MEKMTVMRSFNGSLRDASFSNYLKPDEPNDCEISIFDAQKYFNEGCNNNNNDHHHHQPSFSNNDKISLSSKVSSLGGIPEIPPRFSSASSVDTSYCSRNNYRALGARSFHATPTASSEASWNSQTGLLSNPPGTMKVSLRNVPPVHTQDKKSSKGSSSNTGRWFFRRKCICPCSGKKSIQVHEKFSEPRKVITTINKQSMENVAVVEKSSPVNNKSERFSVVVSRESCNANANGSGSESISNSHKFSSETSFPVTGHRVMATGGGGGGGGRSFTDTTTGFSFPILKHPPCCANNHPISDQDMPPRDSLEVFRPSDDLLINSSSSEFKHRDRRSSFMFPASPKSRTTTIVTTEDDVASDASSDLFEIESFSTQSQMNIMYRRRDSLEDDHERRHSSSTTNAYYPMPITSNSATDYEPSEASIDWSVTTAEGYDRASSVTNFSMAGGEDERQEMEGNNSSSSSNNRTRRGWNGLLSCRCKKAVGVGSSNVNVVGTEGHDRVVGLPVVKHVSGRPWPPPPSSNNNKPKPPLATSHSARLFLPFAT